MSDTFALRGGKKVVTYAFPHVQRPPESYEDETDALKAVRDGAVGQSKESLLREFTGLFLDSLDNQVKHALFFASMHEILYALCTVLDISEGDELICGPFVGGYVDEVAELLGCSIVRYALDPETLGVNYEQFIDLVNEQTKLIIVDHLFGAPTSVQTIKETIGEELLVVEDCSHAHGVVVDGKPAGTVGDFALFPLTYEYLVFTGQGAGAVTNNTLLFDCLSSFKEHDQRNVVYLGSYTQYPFSAFHSVVGKYSLRHRNHILQGSARCHAYLAERMKLVSYCSMIPEPVFAPGDSIAYRYRFVCRYESDALRNLNVQGLITLLQSEGVQIELIEKIGAVNQGKYLLQLPHFYDWYSHKEIIDQYVAAFRKVQINLFC